MLPSHSPLAGDKINLDWPNRTFKAKKGEPAGCIAGSVGRIITRSNLLLSLAFARGDQTRHTVIVNWRNGEHMQPEKNQVGVEASEPFLFCLRPGTYKFSKFGFNIGATNYQPSVDFSVPIDVIDGETRYIGSFMVYDRDVPTDCGEPEVHVHIRVKDNSERDLPRIQAKFGGSRPVVDIPNYDGLQPFLVACTGSGRRLR